MDDIQAQINETTDRLWELRKQAGENAPSRMSKDPRISVGITREEQTELHSLALRCNTSVSALGQLAIKHLLIQSRAGALPMLPLSQTKDHAGPSSHERIDRSQARINELDALIELDRLTDLANGHSP